jgi:imidazolonepropionase-like amidohydrolase
MTLAIVLAVALLHPPTLAVTGARVYVSPDRPPIDNATVVIVDSTITAVGPNAAIPAGATVLRCDGCVVMAGFWNSHVHFEPSQWSSTDPADSLTAHMRAMLTRWGFTTVVDLGSYIVNTNGLRHRIASGEISGPRILTAGGPIYPPHGIPFYVVNTLPPAYLPYLATPSTPDSAARFVDQSVEAGADVVKLFTGSWVKRGTVLPMPLPIAKRAVDEAHHLDRIVFSHCSNLTGARVAIDAGVDVIAHTLDDTRGVDSSLFRTMVDHHMALIPTLTLFADESGFDSVVHEVTIFHAMGGQLIFGTDVGFIHEFDTTREYQFLAQAGLGTVDILRMLTTAPAERLGAARTRGRVEPGLVGDLTILAADPATDPTAFARVRYTIRGGRVIFQM